MDMQEQNKDFRSGMVSIAARSCPHCGEPKSPSEIKGYTDLRLLYWLMGVLGLLCIFIGIGGCTAGGRDSDRIAGAILLVSGIWSFTAAAVLGALRDIARNSWR